MSSAHCAVWISHSVCVGCLGHVEKMEHRKIIKSDMHGERLRGRLV